MLCTYGMQLEYSIIPVSAKKFTFIKIMTSVELNGPVKHYLIKFQTRTSETQQAVLGGKLPFMLHRILAKNIYHLFYILQAKVVYFLRSITMPNFRILSGILKALCVMLLLATVEC
jgi:hypothetical protein